MVMTRVRRGNATRPCATPSTSSATERGHPHLKSTGTSARSPEQESINVSPSSNARRPVSSIRSTTPSEKPSHDASNRPVVW
ncbi:hypothetical protein T484DRAFT_1953250 [Baffinella frigidus]|nr:hypothetical protein T484DRAFT_1953250 [Cryptophyta sp. CCMP2293]